MKIGIIGGGIAGLTAAYALHQKGYQVEVFEAAPAIKAVGAGLGMGANAIKAYEALGLAAELTVVCKIMNGFSLLDEKGKIISAANTSVAGASYSVHRADLHTFLLGKLTDVIIHLGKRLKNINQSAASVEIEFEDGTVYAFDRVIGADGIHSAVRSILWPGVKPRYAGYTCWRGVATFDQELLDAPSETWGKNGRFGMVPLTGNRIYWFACVNTTANDPLMKKWTISDLVRRFGAYHAPIRRVLEQTDPTQVIWSDICDLKPMDQFAWGNIVLIGDAAHATTPNMGQGACQAIEDAVILANLMDKYGNTAFQKFEAVRKPRVHWIVNQSWRLGKVAQLENDLMIGLRNVLFRMLPTKSNEKVIAKVADFQLH